MRKLNINRRRVIKDMKQCHANEFKNALSFYVKIRRRHIKPNTKSVINVCLSHIYYGYKQELFCR